MVSLKGKGGKKGISGGRGVSVGHGSKCGKGSDGDQKGMAVLIKGAVLIKRGSVTVGMVAMGTNSRAMTGKLKLCLWAVSCNSMGCVLTSGAVLDMS